MLTPKSCIKGTVFAWDVALALEYILEGSNFLGGITLGASFKLNSKTFCSYLVLFYPTQCPTYIMLIEKLKISFLKKTGS